MNNLQRTLVLAVLISFSACKQAEDKSINIEELKLNISKLDSNYSHHIGSQHADSIIKLYKADAIFMSPGEASTIGRDQIKTWYQNAFDYGLRNIDYSIKDLIADDAYIIESGSVKVGLTVPDTDTLQYENYKYLHVWEKQENGKYLIVRKMWNNDVAEMNNEE